ncbi:MAG TPA: PLP-dependent aminotransferase family protein [Microbacteriaceae bacterium]
MTRRSRSEEIADDLRLLVEAALPGTKLPATRTLVTRYRTSPVTIQHAIARLVADGLVESRRGAGNYVRERPPIVVTRDFTWQANSLPEPGAVAVQPDSAPRYPEPTIRLDQFYPAGDFLPLYAYHWSSLRSTQNIPAAQRLPPMDGNPQLREHFAQSLTRQGGARFAASDVIVTTGAQEALSVIFRTLAAPGDAVVMEAPTYPGAIAAARAAGLRPVGISRTDDGIDPEHLLGAFQTSGAKLFYAQPTAHVPTGTSWAEEVRSAALAVARRCNAFVIEDDWARDFGFRSAPRPLICDDEHGAVIHIRTLSASMGPALRVAAVTSRGEVTDRIRQVRAVENGFVSPHLQEIAVRLLDAPWWYDWNRKRSLLVHRARDSLNTSLAVHAKSLHQWHWGENGTGLWLRLPQGYRADDVVAEVLLAGYAIAAGDPYWPEAPDGEYIRIGYTTEEGVVMENATRALAAVLGHERMPSRIGEDGRRPNARYRKKY